MQITLFLNHRCNLRCTYCYTGKKMNRPMPLSIARKAIDLGISEAERGYLLISFFGGEPMLELSLMEKICELALEAGREAGKRIFLAVATNGTILDDRRLALLKRHSFQVQVSLDGCPPAQDATRRYRNGRSSHGKVATNLRRLLDEGLSPRVVAVIDPKNVRFLGESFEHLFKLGVRKIQFAPNFSGEWTDEACAELETALRDLGDRFMACFRRGEDVRLDPLNGKIVTHLNQGYKEKNLCQFGKREIAISPRGRIYPCDRLVAEDEDEAVCIGDLDRGIDPERRDALIQTKNTPDDECLACELRPRCMHWCGCVNYETTRSVGRVSPIICWFERCLISEGDRAANLLFSENNPTFFKRFYVPEAVLPKPDPAR
jgi:uncharacterized protein